jgi:hypothetical protein
MSATAEAGTAESATDGDKIVSAVERLVDGPEHILAFVDDLRLGSSSLEVAAERVITHYSNRAALIGGITAAPAMLPGVGTAVGLVAGPLCDMVMLLKYEVEMALALSALHGYDIRDSHERQVAFLLVAARTVSASGGSAPVDVALDGVEIGARSIWNYAPRRVGKLLATTVAALALVQVTRRAFTLVPFLGIAVGAGMNKMLTARVGRQTHADLTLRRGLERRRRGSIL